MRGSPSSCPSESRSWRTARCSTARPTAVAPRYGDASAALEHYQAPAVSLTAEYPCTLSLRLRGSLLAGRAHSPTHALTATTTANELTLTSGADFYLDRDVVILIEDLALPTQSVLAVDAERFVALARSLARSTPPP